MSKKGKVIVTESGVASGAVVYWDLHGTVDRGKFEEALLNQGFTKETMFFPELPSEDVCLSRAVKEQRSSRVLVRPLRNKKGWAIIDEAAKEEDLEYDTRFIVKLDKRGILHFSGNIQDQGVKLIEEAYNRHLHSLRTTDISKWLVTIVEHIDALRLKYNGGIYFIPEKSVDTWRKYKAALESCSENQTQMLPAMKSDEAVEAIIDAISKEVERETTRMDSDLEDKDLGTKALKTRTQRCAALMAKVKRYEQLIDGKLDELREQVDDMQVSIGAALVQAEATEAAA